MKRVIRHYGDHKLYLTAEIFDNSPITQEQLETWYKKFGFVGSHEGKMSRPADTKTACEVPSWAKKNPKLMRALAKKLKKTAGGKDTAMTHADAGLTALLQYMESSGEKKPKRKKHPRRAPPIHEVLRKQAAAKLAIPVALFQAARAGMGLLKGQPQYARLAWGQLKNRVQTAPLMDTLRHYTSHVGAAPGTPLKRPVQLGGHGSPATAQEFYRQLTAATPRKARGGASGFRDVTPYQGTPTEHARVWAAEGVPRPVNPQPFSTGASWGRTSTAVPRARGGTDPDFAKEWGG
jgi:hypothetical protein